MDSAGPVSPGNVVQTGQLVPTLQLSSWRQGRRPPQEVAAEEAPAVRMDAEMTGTSPEVD